MADAVDNPESPLPRTTDGGGNGDERHNNVAEQFPRCMVTNESMLFRAKLQFGHPNALSFRTSFAYYSGLLRSLDLHYILISDSVSLRNFISGNPLLVNLDFQECMFRDFRNLEISSTSLKNLKFECWRRIRTDGDYGLRNCEIKIACPRLVYFKLTVKSVSDLIFQGLNCLKHADILLNCPSDPEHATIEQYNNFMRKLVEGLCEVRDICRLSMPFFECLADGEPESISTKFNNLKCLWLIVGMNKWYMHSMINLLDCCPALEFLVVEFYTLEPTFEHWEIPDKDISCFADRLMVVEIRQFENNEIELGVVKFLLKHGEKLETMSITWNPNVEKSEEIIQQVMEFPASSQRVIVTFE